MTKNIILCVDYHDQNCVIRSFDQATGREQLQTVPTCAERLVGLRENLVSRRTALRNWLNRYLAHETWVDRDGLWCQRGRRRLQQLAEQAPRWDRLVWETKLAELDQLQQHLAQLEAALQGVYQQWPRARRLDQIAGIGVIAAVSIAARIGPI